MELIRGLQALKSEHRHCVVAIGNFDGVHRGHQYLFGQLAQQARQLQLPLLVIIFEPQAQEYFSKETAPIRLSRLREKLLAFEQYGVDRVLCLHFNATLANCSAEDFIRMILVDALAIRYLAVGDDFRFGAQRLGDIALLKKAAKQYAFQLMPMKTVMEAGERVSSTRVRRALEQQNLALAEQLLGRPYRLCGRVVQGDKRGRTIGFPTANLYLHRERLPLKGVYAVRVYLKAGVAISGVANIGQRPTVDGMRSLLEIHLFNFDRDIYGCALAVDFLHYLRDEQRFHSLALLREQIERDVEQAKLFFLSERIS